MASNERNLIRAAEAPFDTLDHGRFTIAVYEVDGKEHVALIKGNVQGEENVPVRVESACLTGTAFHSASCDCAQQLIKSFDIIAENGKGVILYMDEEGRGNGLAAKIRGYAEEHAKDIDTFQAARNLELPQDSRDYEHAALILQDLDVRSIELLTNNPDKLKRLLGYGVRITGRIPVEIPATNKTRRYLRAKQRVTGHLFRQRL